MGRPLKIFSVDDLNLSLINNVPDHARLNTEEVRKVLGYAHGQSVNQAVERGAFPEHDFATKHKFSGRLIVRHFWKVSTIKKFLKEKHNVEIPAKNSL